MSQETWLFLFVFKLSYFLRNLSLWLFSLPSYNCGTLIIWDNLCLECFSLEKMR